MIDAIDAFEHPSTIPLASSALGTGIGRLTHAQELFQRGRAIKAYEARAKKGKGGTHMGRRKKESS